MKAKDVAVMAGVVFVALVPLALAGTLYWLFGRPCPEANMSAQGLRAIVGIYIPLIIVVAEAGVLLLGPSSRWVCSRRH